MQVPRILHHVWIQGYDAMPSEDRKNVDNLHRLNPGWKNIVWDDEMIQKLLQKYPEILNVYNNVQNLPETDARINPLASKSDIARWVILYEYGGCYMDADVVCITGLDEIMEKLPDKNPLLGTGKYLPRVYHAGFLISTQYNPIFEGAMKKVLVAKDRAMLGGCMTDTVNDMTDENRDLDGLYLFNTDDVAIYHCGTASKCMLPIKVGSSAGVYPRKLYGFWCRHKNRIGIWLTVLSILSVLLLVYVLVRSGGYTIHDCVKTLDGAMCKVR